MNPEKKCRAINAYLTFNGNCKEAMEFYKACLGGHLEMMDFSQAPAEMEIPAEAKRQIMHATLTHDNLVLMASDSPQRPVKNGDAVSLSLNCISEEEINSTFAKMAEGGEITMPLEDTFWGARFGMLTDKFGIHWMFNYDRPQA